MRVRPDPVVVRGFGPPWLRLVFGAVGALYIACVFLDGAGSRVPSHLPHTFRYFTQVACLFPWAQPDVIDYRAEAWSCRDHRFHELDVRPYFPLRPDDKENRYQRLMFFYRENAEVMHALDTYLVSHHNARVARGGEAGDGVDGPIGGLRLLDLRIPIPPPGTHEVLPRREPLDSYPEKYRKYWYHTPDRVIAARCREEDGR